MASKRMVVLVTRAGLGTSSEADRAFGLEMLEKFFHTVEALPDKPVAICFYTEGVRLVVKGSPVIPALQLLEGMGVRLVACKTCLAYFGIEDQLAVGGTGGMKDIVDLMTAADSVITV